MFVYTVWGVAWHTSWLLLTALIGVLTASANASYMLMFASIALCGASVWSYFVGIYTALGLLNYSLAGPQPNGPLLGV